MHWLMLPMCDNADDIREYVKIINSIDPGWLAKHGALQIICETPKGLQNLHNMLESIPEVQGVVAGAGDFLRFAQGSSDALLSKIRWEVLNACLCHGCFPIDSLPLSLAKNGDIVESHATGAVDHGLRAGIILHPQQTDLFNEIFSPSSEQLATATDLVPDWLNKRDSGYNRGSGDGKLIPVYNISSFYPLFSHGVYFYE